MATTPAGRPGYRTLTVEVEPVDGAGGGAVATVTLERPEVMNALSHELEAELHDALQRADRDPFVRAIVLTGSGRAFSSGYDMGDFDDMPDPVADFSADVISAWQRRNAEEVARLREMWLLSTPIVTAVGGYCMGGGFWYALASDITIAADDAVFAQPEVRMTSSSTFLFAALCGWKVANRYALTGDHFDAAEALRIGVVTEVVPRDLLLPTARAIARRIALVPEPSVRINKAVTMMGLLAAGLDAGLLLNGTLNSLVHSSYGPDRARLDEAMREGGLRAFLRARDDAFRPEPFGPRSDPPATPTAETT